MAEMGRRNIQNILRRLSQVREIFAMASED
jgi:hypothetical protein